MTLAFWIRYVGAIATVGAVLWLLTRLAAVVRRRRPSSHGSRVSVVASIALAPNASMHVVRAGDSEFLVAAGASMMPLVQQPRNDVDDQRQNCRTITERNQPVHQNEAP
jgi:flagellar biogenesis protein FliO